MVVYAVPIIFFWIYISVDTYMIFLERGRECGAPEKVRDFLGCFASC